MLGETGSVCGWIVPGARKWGRQSLFCWVLLGSLLHLFIPLGWKLLPLLQSLQLWHHLKLFPDIFCPVGDSIIFHLQHWDSVNVGLFEYSQSPGSISWRWRFFPPLSSENTSFSLSRWCQFHFSTIRGCDWFFGYDYTWIRLSHRSPAVVLHN